MRLRGADEPDAEAPGSDADADVHDAVGDAAVATVAQGWRAEESQGRSTRTGASSGDDTRGRRLQGEHGSSQRRSTRAGGRPGGCSPVLRLLGRVRDASRQRPEARSGTPPGGGALARAEPGTASLDARGLAARRRRARGAFAGCSGQPGALTARRLLNKGSTGSVTNGSGSSEMPLWRSPTRCQRGCGSGELRVEVPGVTSMTKRVK